MPLSAGIKDMFTQVAMRVVELSKIDHDSKHYSYSSFTSSQVITSASHDHDHQERHQHQQQQHVQQQQQEQSSLTTPNITLNKDSDGKKGWCCWR